MSPLSYTYNSGRFSEDDGHMPHSPGSSPPPPYDVVLAGRHRRASASHPQDPSSPISTAFRETQHGSQTQDHGHVTSISPEAAYAAVLASGMTGVEGLVYRHLVQVPYPGTGYPPGYPPGSPPVPLGFPPSPQPVSLLLQQASAYPVPQPLPTHTGADPAAAVRGQQPTAVATTTSTSASTPTAADCTGPWWTPEQDRLLLLRKDEYNSLSDMSAALDEVFHVKRDADAIAKRLKHLRARSKVWGEDKLKQAVPSAASLNCSPAEDHAQLAGIRDAVQRELDAMVRQGNLAGDMEQKLLDEQRESSARFTAAMRLTDRGREQERADGVVDEDGDATRGQVVEDYEIV
ncbi:hypothetical protein QBC45DRAFT_8286 [Copromyces sp. CBS 386.78]|nr:hypothetical protein QBC45DRAFT_8286 [Copromyces sp. CBS 386.78]